MTDFGAFYREHVDDLGSMAADLSEEQFAAVVPATPQWTVHQVFCHLAGGASDALADRMDDAPGPAWTARHVAERDQRPLSELLEELRSNQDAAAASMVDSPFPGLAFDISVHHADLHEAFGKPPLAERLWMPVLDAMRPRLDPALLESTSPYEVYRGLFSRRSRAQMQGWGSPLTGAELDEMCIFGPRDDDQPGSA